MAGELPSNESVREALKRILESQSFRGAAQQREILRFILEAELGGRRDELKASVIAQELFGGSEDQLRPAVGRVRLKLLEYYDSEGISDPVRIAIPKGGYVPTFRLSSGNASIADSEGRPTPPPSSAGTTSGSALESEKSTCQINIWHIAHPRNLLFKGRETDLRALRDHGLGRGQRRTIDVLAALPGLGRTSIAVEYAYRHRDHYRLVWWIDARAESSVQSDLNLLAKRLDPAFVPGRDSDSTVDRVSEACATFSDWLLIFDDAPTADVVRPYLPKTGNGHIIVTTSDRDWRGIATVQDVPPLDPLSALAFIDSRFKNSSVRLPADQLKTLVQELHCIPAALVNAANYLELTGCPVSSYLTRLRSLRYKHFPELDLKHSAELIVADTWQLTVARAKAESPAVPLLLKFIQWLDDCTIPADYIDELSVLDHELCSSLRLRVILVILGWVYRRSLSEPKPRLLPFRASSYQNSFRDAFATLIRYSIIREDESGFTVPPLINVITKNLQLNWQQRRWLRITLASTATLASKAAIRGDARNRELWIRHLRKAIDHATSMGMNQSVEEFRDACRTLESFELQGPHSSPTPTATSAQTPVSARLSVRDYYEVLKLIAKDIGPFFFAAAGCFLLMVVSLSVLLYLYVHASALGPPSSVSESWLEPPAIAGVVSAMGVTVFLRLHHRHEGTKMSSSDDAP